MPPAVSVPATPFPSTPETVAGLPPLPREGQAFQVVPEESLLTVLIFRGGALSRAGHNHVIASRSLSGMAWMPDDAGRSSFDITVPVGDFTIDEPELRALEGPDFSADVPDSARDGTKRNMLSVPMLDGEHFPQIVLRASRMEALPDGALLAEVYVVVRDQTRRVAVPLKYSFDGDALTTSGELTLKQTDLGLTPFSLFGGALRVEDEMKVKFRVVARASQAGVTPPQR
jgi:hypothetical protein